MRRRALVTANQLEAAAHAVPRVGNKLTCRGARERGWQPALAQFPREEATKMEEGSTGRGGEAAREETGGRRRATIGVKGREERLLVARVFTVGAFYTRR
jgi:hypothetical protein